MAGRNRGTNGRTSRAVWIAVSVALFGVGMSQPAFFWGSAAQSSGPALRILFEGWRGLHVGYFEWLANPLLAASWGTALAGRRLTSASAALLALACMLVFSLRHSVGLPGGGVGTPIVAYGAGYWLWVASALWMVCTTFDGVTDRLREGYIRRHPNFKDSS